MSKLTKNIGHNYETNKTNEMYCAKKIILNKLIPGTIILNIMCSLFIDFHEGILLLIKKWAHRVSRYGLSKCRTFE